MQTKTKPPTLIEKYQCDLHLDVRPDMRYEGRRHLRASYSYSVDGKICVSPHIHRMPSEVTHAFICLMYKRGLVMKPAQTDPENGGTYDVMEPDSSAPGRRWKMLMPGLVPRYVRVYDNEGRSFDRYTAVFSGRTAVMRGGPGQPNQYPYIGMSANPYHPQGFGQHGHTDHSACDAVGGKWPPAIGRSNHLGKRIAFADLPADCQDLVIRDYIAIWNL